MTAALDLPPHEHGSCMEARVLAVTRSLLPRAIAIATAVWFAALGCGGSVPKPALAPQPESAFSEVPYPPPPPRSEEVPASPRKDAVWVDGQWMWKAKRWVWDAGGWVVPPANGRFARWETHRLADGSLTHALGVWRDPSGKALPYPEVLAPPRNEPRVNHGPAFSCAPPEASAATTPTAPGSEPRSCP